MAAQLPQYDGADDVFEHMADGYRNEPLLVLHGCGRVCRSTLDSRISQADRWLPLKRLFQQGSQRQGETGTDLGLEPCIRQRQLPPGRHNEYVVLRATWRGHAYLAAP